jgi:hypothetical protein
VAVAALTVSRRGAGGQSDNRQKYMSGGLKNTMVDPQSAAVDTD